jgi:Protein of unknown function (DUF3800)
MCFAVKALASSLCLEDDDFMAMMTVYFDDSGTHDQSEIAVAACLISDVRRWQSYESEWKSVLDDAGIREAGFHMAEFNARKPPFDGWTEQKRDQVIRGLIEIINRYAFAGTATAVVKKDYDALVIGKLREKLGRYHYTFAVQSCLAFLEEWMDSSDARQPVQYIFDLMGRGKHEIIDLFDDIAGREMAASFGIEPGGYGFSNKRLVVQLQAADILAWEANKYAKDHHAADLPARRSFQSMADNIEIKTRFFDASGLPDFVQDVTSRYEAQGWTGPLGGFL